MRPGKYIKGQVCAECSHVSDLHPYDHVGDRQWKRVCPDCGNDDGRSNWIVKTMRLEGPWWKRKWVAR